MDTFSGPKDIQLLEVSLYCIVLFRRIASGFPIAQKGRANCIWNTEEIHWVLITLSIKKNKTFAIRKFALIRFDEECGLRS